MKDESIWCLPLNESAFIWHKGLFRDAFEQCPVGHCVNNPHLSNIGYRCTIQLCKSSFLICVIGFAIALSLWYVHITFTIFQCFCPFFRTDHNRYKPKHSAKLTSWNLRTISREKISVNSRVLLVLSFS